MLSEPSSSKDVVAPITLARGTARLSGKFWKDEKQPFRRAHLSPAVKSKSWQAQVEANTKEKAIRKLIKELKDEKETAEKERKQRIVDRRKAKEEAARLELMKSKMNAKRALRMRRKAGRTKKINH